MKEHDGCARHILAIDVVTFVTDLGRIEMRGTYFETWPTKHTSAYQTSTPFDWFRYAPEGFPGRATLSGHHSQRGTEALYASLASSRFVW